MKYTTEEVKNAYESLRHHCPIGKTVYCVLRNVSRSGMSRRIDFYTLDGERMQWLTAWMHVIFDTKMGDKQGMRVDGCGMDMGFATVYNLSRALYRDGFGVVSEGGIRPKSKEHAAELVKGKKTKFCGRNGDHSGWDNDGGYALRSEWV